MRIKLLPVFVVVLALAMACAGPRPGDESEEKAPTSEALDESGSDTDETELLERLGAIGYVGGVTPATTGGGIVQFVPSAVQPGFNLYTSGHAPTAILMDLTGNVIHRWQAEFSDLFPEHTRPPHSERGWRHVQLLPDGYLIGIWEPYGIFKLDRDSNIVWSNPNRAHHEFFISEDGRIHHLGFRRAVLDLDSGQKWIDDLIVTLDADGRELKRLSMAAALADADWRALRAEFWIREDDRDSHIEPAARFDPFHTNSIWLLSEDEAGWLGPPFAAGQALVSMCLLDTIAAIDMDEGEVRWWQTGPFALQHQPRPTPDGFLVLFNNHVSRRESSVQMIDPGTGEVHWEYFGPNDYPLFSESSGSVEPLANGNLLIVESNRGRVLEVTRKREVVWEFRSPHRTGRDGELTANLYQVERIAEATWTATDMLTKKSRSEARALGAGGVGYSPRP